MGNIKGKFHIAADVGAHRDAVDPNLGVIVTGTDVEMGAAAALQPALGEGDGAAVPNALAEVHVTDAGEHRLAAEGDGDGAGQGTVGLGEATGTAALAVVGFVLPGTVEIEPFGTGKIGTRIFGARNIHSKVSFVDVVVIAIVQYFPRFVKR